MKDNNDVFNQKKKLLQLHRRVVNLKALALERQYSVDTGEGVIILIVSDSLRVVVRTSGRGGAHFREVLVMGLAEHLGLARNTAASGPCARPFKTQ